MSQVHERAALVIEDSVRRAVEGRDVAVAFSGGVDSGLVGALASRYASSVHLYVAGVRGCHDIEAAESAASVLGLDLTVLEVDADKAADMIMSQMKITGTTNPLVLALTSPLYCVMSRCNESYIAAGQGADEVFGGYNKYVSVKDCDLKAAMKADSDRFFSETRPHEECIASHFGKTILRPYLDDGVVSLMGSLPPEQIRPSPTDRKKVLCDAARYLGYGFLADRPKKAAQYGSGILDAVKQYCRSEGMEYNVLVSKFKESLDADGMKIGI